MIVELPQDGGGVIVDLGPKRLPLVDADAQRRPRVARATRPASRSQARRPAAGAARPPTATPRTLAQRPALQGAMVVIEPHTGRVLALVGGYDWTASQFDRATQAKRQVGSSIKPFIYCGGARGRQDARRAHARRPVLGHDRDRRVDAGELRQQVPRRRHADDRARVLAQHDQRAARRRRSASIASSRSCAASASRRRSRATSRSASARRTSRCSRSPPATPASRTAAAGSRRGSSISSPTPRGHVVEDLRNTPPGPQVISPEVDYVIVNLMKGVVQRGTARYALALGRPAAGKTGTSANYRDVWFNGFTTDLLALGVDRPRRLDADRRQDHRRRRRGADLARLHAEGAPAHEGPRLPGAAERQLRARRAVERRSRPVRRRRGGVDAVRARHAARASSSPAPPVRSFDDLVPAPPVPRPPAKCASLSCL